MSEQVGPYLEGESEEIETRTVKPKYEVQERQSFSLGEGKLLVLYGALSISKQQAALGQKWLELLTRT